MFLAKPLELKNIYEEQESGIFYFELINFKFLKVSFESREYAFS